MNSLDKDGKTFVDELMRAFGVSTRQDRHLFSEPQRGGAAGLGLYHDTQVYKAHRHLQMQESRVMA